MTNRDDLFNPAEKLTITSRLSSSEQNLQQTPRKEATEKLAVDRVDTFKGDFHSGSACVTGTDARPLRSNDLWSPDTLQPGNSGPLAQQVGGSHYKALAIQPVEYCQRNHLGFCESSVIKYVTRHKEKHGAEDIKKAIHFLQMLLQIEYPTEEQP